MNMLMALAIAVGVLLAVWIKVTSMVGMFWYVGVLGWASYVAAGGRMNGIKKTIVGGLAGMFWTAVGEFLLLQTGHMELDWLVLGIVAFIIVAESRIALVSFIPAAFLGAAVIGAGGPVGIFDAPTNLKLAISFVIGPVLGFIADAVAGMMAKRA